MLRLSSLLFCHCSRNNRPYCSPIAFKPTAWTKCSMCILKERKKCTLKHLGKKLHHPPLHETGKIKDYEQRNSLAFPEVLLSTMSCVS